MNNIIKVEQLLNTFYAYIGSKEVIIKITEF